MSLKSSSINLASISAIAVLCAAQCLAQGSAGQSGSTSTGQSGSMNSGQSGTTSTGQSGSMGSSRSGSMGSGQSGSMGSGSMGMGQSSASAADKKFVQKAMAGGMAEVQLGQLATQKASSSDVKDFGQKMVDDHTKLNDQMKPIGAQLGITPPATLTPKDQALMTKLQGLSGAAFDKAYINAMVADHKEDDKEFKTEETSGKDPQVKDAATQGEPIIAQHLQMAQDMQKKAMK